jgi:plastocyanin
MGGDHMGMMNRGSSGADQPPVLSEAKQVTVEMRDYEFFSAKLTVNAGTEVTWVNRDSVPHNAVAKDGTFDTGNLNAGDSGSVVVEQPGTYPYVCTYHPGMEATLTVRS